MRGYDSGSEYVVKPGRRLNSKLYFSNNFVYKVIRTSKKDELSHFVT